MTEQLRVAHVVTRLNVGGPARVLDALVCRLDREGVEQIVIHGKEGPDEGRIDICRGRLVEVPVLRRSLHPLRDPVALGTLARELRRFRPHVVHTRMAKAGALGRWAARRSATPAVVHTFHGHVLDGYFSRFAEKGFLMAEQRLAQMSDALIAVSENVRDELLAARIGNRALWNVIPNGYDLSALAGCTLTPAAARARLGLPADGPVVGVVGRLVPIKDHDTFLAAARLVAAQEPAVSFVIAGGGPERGRLETAASSLGLRVKFLGWVSDLSTLYRALDVVVLTSANEGTPAALIEAAAAGVPAVATRVGGVPDVVVDGVTGILVPTREPAARGEEQLRVLRDDRLRAKMGEAARKHVLARFDPDAAAARHLELYERLVARL